MQATEKAAVCKHLRSKQYYMSNQEHASGTSGGQPPHSWCLKTMKVMGPDCRAASHATCGAGRRCYESDGFWPATWAPDEETERPA